MTFSRVTVPPGAVACTRSLPRQTYVVAAVSALFLLESVKPLAS